MSPEVSFSTSEVSREAAHRLVDAAFDAIAPPVVVSDEDRKEATALVDLSSSPVWVALLGILAADGEASVRQLAALTGKSIRGCLVAVGRAVDSYDAHPWTWSGSGDNQQVKIEEGLRIALKQERSGENFGQGI